MFEILGLLLVGGIIGIVVTEGIDAFNHWVDNPRRR